MPSDHHGFIPSSAEGLLRQRMKVELRKRMRGLRQTLPASACAARSSRVVAALLDHAAVREARSVALFWPIVERHEVDLRPLDSDLRARGVRVAYPAVDPETREMTFRYVQDIDAMAEQGFGFREPRASDPPAALDGLDAVVVPALAFDPRGHRVGYGAGYYDRTLPAYAPPAVTLVVGFDFQLVVDVPSTESDVPVHWIVTDARATRAET